MQTTCTHEVGDCITANPEWRCDYWQRIQDAEAILNILDFVVVIMRRDGFWTCQFGNSGEYRGKGETQSQAIVAAALMMHRVDVYE